MDQADTSWRAFWREAPGQRFSRRHQRLRRQGANPLARVLRAAAGVLLVLVGIVFLPLPGPGFVPILAGAALLAGESRRMAKWLDAGEVRVRGWLGRR